MATPLLLTIMLLVVPVGFLLILLCSYQRRKRQAALLFVQGVGFIKLLRSLLTYIQQHRGLTTGFINGNTAVQPDIQTLAVTIKRIMTEIDTATWMHNNIKWCSLHDHWSRLGSLYTQGDAEKNFKQHNILIANLLYLIDDVADVHHLAKVTGDAMDTDWRYLLSIAEYIGQARALGTGVAAKGECSSVLRIQLNHLRNKIASSVDSTWPEQSRTEINNLLHCIETQLVVGRPSIKAADYFTLATRCIEHVLNQFDQQIERLEYDRP